MTGHVASIAYKRGDLELRPADRFSRTTINRVTLVAGHGIDGDAKSRPDSRQLNVMFAETVEQLRTEGFRCAPGELGEQIIISGIPANFMAPGICLRLGATAIIQLVYLRVPCGRFERIQGQPKDAVRGRLGFMVKVLIGGEIAVGCAVAVELGYASSNSDVPENVEN